LVEPEALGFIEQLPRFDFSRERLPELRALLKKMILEMRMAPIPGVTARRAVALGLEAGRMSR